MKRLLWLVIVLCATLGAFGGAQQRLDCTQTPGTNGAFTLACQPAPTEGAPTITALIAAPSTIDAGTASRLSWTLGGGPVTSLRIDPGVGGVPATSRNRVVAPTVTTTYTLTASGPGGSVSQTVPVIVRVPPPPPPTPVNCAGTWSAWARVAGSETACSVNSRTYQESRAFTVATPPASGGTACPASPETRTQTEGCSVTPPPASPTTAALQASLLNFAQIWKRNWNHGGHTVVVGAGSPPFGENYGFWDYTETTTEPWLFDRASQGYRLHALTNDPQWKAQADSDFAFYAARIDAQGIFTPKGAGDTKYSYVTPFVLAGTLTAAQRAAADRIYQAWLSDWPSTANLGSAALWTERENGLALEAAVSYYRLTQNSAAVARAFALIDQWDAVVQQTGNLGAPRVSYTKHEGGGPGGTTPSDPVSSPWMAALYFQAARQFIELRPEAAPQVYRQVSNYFNYLDGPYNGQTRGFYDASLAHPENSGFMFPAYLTETQLGDAGYDAAHQAHALDVAGLVAFAVTAKEALGQDTTRAALRLAQMKATAARTFSTEPGAYERTATWLPRYRVNPPRAGNWWIRGLYELVSLGR